MADDYDASSIIVLDAVDAIRRRPGMYVGDVDDGSGMHHLLWELVGNAIDEHLAGHAHRLRVTIEADAVTVDDDGRGLPIDTCPDGRPVLESVATQLHCGSRGKRPHVHVGRQLYGVGLAAVNALSAELTIDTCADGRRVMQSFARGRALHPQRELGETREVGTRIRFAPDFEIFARRPWALAEIECRLQELAWLNPRLRIVLDGRELCGAGGLPSWVERITASRRRVGARIDARGCRNDVEAEVVMQWCTEDDFELHAFVGQFATTRGAHAVGLIEGVCTALRSAIPGAARVLTPALFEVASAGLVVVARIELDDPRFGDPTRDRLETHEAAIAVHGLVAAATADALANDALLRDHLRGRFRSTSSAR